MNRKEKNGNEYPLPITPDWNKIVATEVIEKPTLEDDCRLKVPTNHGVLYFSILEKGIRIQSEKQFENDYRLLVNEPKNLESKLKFTENFAILKSENLSLKIEFEPLTIEINSRIKSANDGHFTRKHRVPPFALIDGKWLVSLALKSNEAIYGLGEKWGSLNKRGQLIRSYNLDALGVNSEISYKNVPFAWSPNGWGIFAHTPSPVTSAAGFPQWSNRSYCMLIEDDTLDVFLFIADEDAENKGAEIISQYTDLTGRSPVPPRWSAGVILSKAYYKDADEILETAKKVREKKMPCDVITFDGRAWQDTDTRFSFEWCKKRYLNPQAVIDELKALDFKICVWEYPLISVKNDWFKMFEKRDWLIKDKRTNRAFRYEWDQQAFGKVLTPLPDSGIVDFTNKDAYEFWRDAHEDLFEMGVDMIKADFGEQLEDENMVTSNGESDFKLHNVYAYLYNRCVYEAAEMYSRTKPFLFSRSAWIGSQRFNSQWGGDPQADWEGMMANIRGGLSWGLSGSPFYATDVGGFYGDTRDEKLYIRWAQNAVFSAHYRLHGIGNREPWSYGEYAEKIVMDALKLRYQLIPYIEKCYAQANEKGLPVQRPMVLAFPNNQETWAFENQFMFGDELLVVPCFDEKGWVEFYLPEGVWKQFDISEKYDAKFEGQRFYRKKLEDGEIAVFIRKGRSIELAKPVDITDKIDEIYLYQA